MPAATPDLRAAPIGWPARHGPWIAATCAWLALAVVAAGLGHVRVPLGTLWEVLSHPGAPAASDPAAHAIVWQIRLPRIVVASLVGAGLAAAGAAFQQLFRNPLVAPDTLGVASGAALGAAVALLLGAGIVLVEVAAFGGGLVAVLLVMLIAARLTAHEPLTTLILTGVVVASLIGAAIALVKTIADPYNQLAAITFWLLGSFAAATPREMLAAGVPIAVALAVMGALAWRIDVLAQPEDEARALGVDTVGLRRVVVAAATLGTAACVAVSGVVGWVGLVVPHMARLLTGPSFRRLLPLATALGALFMLAIDTLARTLLPGEIAPGILTAVVGTPVFLALLARPAAGA